MAAGQSAWGGTPAHDEEFDAVEALLGVVFDDEVVDQHVVLARSDARH